MERRGEAALLGRGWGQAEGSVLGFMYWGKELGGGGGGMEEEDRDHLGRDRPGVMVWEGKVDSS